MKTSNVEHKRINNRDIDVYTYTNEGQSLSLDDYFELLDDFLKKDNMVFDYINYEYDVESEHIGRNTIYDMNQIDKLRRSFPTSVDAFFNDSNKNYWLSYSLLFKDRINLYTSNIIHKEESKKPTL